MKQTPIAFLFSCLSLAGLLVVCCTPVTRHIDQGTTAGDGGDGSLTSLGGSHTAGRGTGAEGVMPFAGFGAASMGGTDLGGGAGVGGSGGGGEPQCTAEEKLCEGACVKISDPAYGCDPTLCSADGCPDSSAGTLVCEGGQCVLGTCEDGAKSCNERCVSISDPAFGCGATTCDASTCPNVSTGGTLACDGSACVIDTCPANYKKCGNKCVAISDPTYGCGATTCDSTSCPAAGTGTLVCQGSACILGTCSAGTKKCGDKCVTTDANNGCAEAARCTACANNEACTGTPTKCQCVPIAKATACDGKCGMVSNGCGGMHDCGDTCMSPKSCSGGGTPNVCGCTPTPMATACSGKNCDSVPNGCGGTYICGTCTSPQTCAGAGTPNVCGCTKTPMATACSGKNCGPAPDGCNGTYTCGTCSSSSLPICVSGTCKQCSSVSDCPSGTFNCTNNKCVCRAPSGANVIKDGGFDTASTLSNWTSSSTNWTNTDADACPGSGSVTISGSISRCFQIPTVPPGGTNYTLGVKYKSGDVGDGCFGSFNQDASCTAGVGPDFLNLGIGGSDTWTSTSTTNLVYEGTSSILVTCQTSSGVMIDQMFLRVSGFTGPGF